MSAAIHSDATLRGKRMQAGEAASRGVASLATLRPAPECRHPSASGELDSGLEASTASPLAMRDGGLSLNDHLLWSERETCYSSKCQTHQASKWNTTTKQEQPLGDNVEIATGDQSPEVSLETSHGHAVPTAYAAPPPQWRRQLEGPAVHGRHARGRRAVGQAPARRHSSTLQFPHPGRRGVGHRLA